MLRESFSLLEMRGVEKKCSSSLTVHLGYCPAPYVTTWQRASVNRNFRRGRHHLTLGNKRRILTWFLVGGYERRKRHSWDWREHLGMVSGEDYPSSKHGVFQSYFPFLLLFPRSSPHYWHITSDFSLCTSVPSGLASWLPSQPTSIWRDPEDLYHTPHTRILEKTCFHPLSKHNSSPPPTSVSLHFFFGHISYSTLVFSYS